MHYENENMWCIGVKNECIEMMLKDCTCEKYDDLGMNYFLKYSI